MTVDIEESLGSKKTEMTHDELTMDARSVTAKQNIARKEHGSI